MELVQAAVPAGLSEDLGGVLIALAKDAVESAVAFAQKRGIAEDLPQLRELVGKLASQPVRPVTDGYRETLSLKVRSAGGERELAPEGVELHALFRGRVDDGPMPTA